jgi:hypothetical protein
MAAKHFPEIANRLNLLYLRDDLLWGFHLPYFTLPD